MHTRRLPFLALAMASLILAIWGGELRLGWPLPPTPAAGHHGALMIGGFLGGVIGLERAVALGRPWGYLVPLLSGMGALGLLIASPIAPWMLMLASLGLIGLYLQVWRLQAAPWTLVMTGGATCWLIGNLLWANAHPMPMVVAWWSAFLVLTIVGERLELNRLLPPHPRQSLLFALSLGTYLAGLMLHARVQGLGLAALALWLLRFDVVRVTIRQTGLPRFMAVALGSGYVWLLAAGLLRLFGAAPDAQYHALFLGFVFSMIMAHAPVIFPAVLGRPMAFGRHFYLHLAFLHGSLLLRVAGDPAWGGLANGLSILVFVLVTAHAVASGSLPSKR